MDSIEDTDDFLDSFDEDILEVLDIFSGDVLTELDDSFMVEFEVFLYGLRLV